MLAQSRNLAAPGVPLLHILNPLVSAGSLDELKASTAEALRLVLPCEHFLFLRGEREGGRVQLHDCVQSTPQSYVSTLMNSEVPPTRPELIECIGRPRFTHTDRLQTAFDRPWVELLRRNRIRNFVWTLLPDATPRGFLGYFFSNVPSALFGEARLRTALIASHIHIALQRTWRDSRPLDGQSLVEPGQPPLSGRETEVVRWVACGKTNAEIGRILKISDKTVKTHVQNILCKLALANRAQIAAYYANHPEMAFAVAAG